MDIELQKQLSDPEKRRQHIKALAQINPIVHRCLYLQEYAGLTYEGALELAVCYLADENKERFDQLCELIKRLPPPVPYVPPLSTDD